MKRKKIVIIVSGVIVLLALISSGWVYSVIHTNRTTELTVLYDTFRQQYGNEAVINKLVSPKKVYAISWSDNGYNNISWNIGGIWVTVFSTPDESITTREAE